MPAEAPFQAWLGAEGIRRLGADFKWIAALCGALVLLAISGLLLYVNTSRLIQTSTGVSESQAIAATQEELLARMTEAEAGLFGYIITGEREFLEPYLAATNRISELLVALHDAIEDESRHQERLDALEPLIAKRLAFIEHRIEVRSTEGEEAAAALVRMREAKPVMDSIRQLLAEMKEAQDQLLQTRRQMAFDTAQKTLLWVAGFGSFSVLMLGLIFWRLLHENARRRASEASLELERNELERRVDERTACLARSNQSLQSEIAERQEAERKLSEAAQAVAEKNKELETLVYVASHDLRSPLVNIQGFSKELASACTRLRHCLDNENRTFSSEETGVLLKQDIPEAIDYILAGVAKMDSLLSGFLRYSRLGRAALKSERLAMTAMIRGIARSMEFQMNEAGAVIEIENVPPCIGDPVQVNQVFSNLLDNAVKYRHPGRPGKIHVSGWVENGRVIYRVSDNGIGIASEHQSKVFEIFQRLNPGSGNGEGLGLAISQRIVERLDGRIWLASEPGLGSSFFVALPAA